MAWEYDEYNVMVSSRLALQISPSQNVLGDLFVVDCGTKAKPPFTKNMWIRYRYFINISFVINHKYNRNIRDIL